MTSTYLSLFFHCLSPANFTSTISVDATKSLFSQDFFSALLPIRAFSQTLSRVLAQAICIKDLGRFHIHFFKINCYTTLISQMLLQTNYFLCKSCSHKILQHHNAQLRQQPPPQTAFFVQPASPSYLFSRHQDGLRPSA